MPTKQEGMTKEVSKKLRQFDDQGFFIGQPTWNCFKDNTPSDILTRQYKLLDYTIDPSWTFLNHQELNFPQALFAVPTIENFLKPFKYFRAGVEISVQVNSTIYHQGMMVSCFIHDCSPDPITSLTATEMSCLNSVYYNYSTADSAILRYSMLAPVIWCTIGAADENACIGKLLLAPFIAIANSAGGNESITVTVMARFVNPKTAGYRAVTASGGKVHKQSASAEEVQKTQNHTLFGPSSSPVKAVLGVAKGVIEDIEDLGDLITGGLLDKPTALDFPTKVVQDYGSELISGKGASIATKLQLYPEFKLGEMPNGMESTSMTFRELAGKPALHMLVDASSPTWACTIGCNPLWAGNMNYLVGQEDVTISPDYLMSVALLHTYWRGSIRYHIKFVTSSLTTGRVRISYCNNDLPDVNGGDNPNMILDIKGTTEVNLTVPYLNPYYMKLTGGDKTEPFLRIEYTLPPVTSGNLDPNITMVAFRSGGVDTLWALPVTVQSPLIEKQSLRKTFDTEKFPSFSNSETLAVLKGVTVTEQSGYIQDLYKRYINIPATEPDPNLVLYDNFLFKSKASYLWNANIAPFQWYSAHFKYVRGGVRVGYQTPATDTNVNFISPSANGVNYNVGSGIVTQDPVKQRTIFVELPYFSTTIWIDKTANSNFSSVYNPPYTKIAGPAVAEMTYLASADDRLMYYLLPPPLIPGAPLPFKKTKKESKQ